MSNTTRPFVANSTTMAMRQYTTATAGRVQYRSLRYSRSSMRLSVGQQAGGRNDAGVRVSLSAAAITDDALLNDPPPRAPTIRRASAPPKDYDDRTK
jgi:hypothetical protein